MLQNVALIHLLIGSKEIGKKIKHFRHFLIKLSIFGGKYFLSHMTKNFHSLFFCIKQCEFVVDDNYTQFRVKRKHIQVVAEVVSVVVWTVIISVIVSVIVWPVVGLYH